MRPKSSSMVKFGYFFLIVDLIAAGIFWLAHDRSRTVMFLLGSVVWTVGILVWSREDKD